MSSVSPKVFFHEHYHGDLRVCHNLVAFSRICQRAATDLVALAVPCQGAPPLSSPSPVSLPSPSPKVSLSVPTYYHTANVNSCRWRGSTLIQFEILRPRTFSSEECAPPSNTLGVLSTVVRSVKGLFGWKLCSLRCVKHIVTQCNSALVKKYFLTIIHWNSVITRNPL